MVKEPFQGMALPEASATKDPQTMHPELSLHEPRRESVGSHSESSRCARDGEVVSGVLDNSVRLFVQALQDDVRRMIDRALQTSCEGEMLHENIHRGQAQDGGMSALSAHVTHLQTEVVSLHDARSNWELQKLKEHNASLWREVASLRADVDASKSRLDGVVALRPSTSAEDTLQHDGDGLVSIKASVSQLQDEMLLLQKGGAALQAELADLRDEAQGCGVSADDIDTLVKEISGMKVEFEYLRAAGVRSGEVRILTDHIAALQRELCASDVGDSGDLGTVPEQLAALQRERALPRVRRTKVVSTLQKDRLSLLHEEGVGENVPSVDVDAMQHGTQIMLLQRELPALREEFMALRDISVSRDEFRPTCQSVTSLKGELEELRRFIGCEAKCSNSLNDVEPTTHGREGRLWSSSMQEQVAEQFVDAAVEAAANALPATVNPVWVARFCTRSKDQGVCPTDPADSDGAVLGCRRCIPP